MNIYVKVREKGNSFVLFEQGITLGGNQNAPVEVEKTQTVIQAIKNRALIEVSEQELKIAMTKKSKDESEKGNDKPEKISKENIQAVIESENYTEMVRVASEIGIEFKKRPSKVDIKEALENYLEM